VTEPDPQQEPTPEELGVCGVTAADRPETPCVLPWGHGGEVHRDDTGWEWAAPNAAGGPHRVVVEPSLPDPLPPDMPPVPDADRAELARMLSEFGAANVQAVIDQLEGQMW
jgi:hypothetical protein